MAQFWISSTDRPLRRPFMFLTSPMLSAPSPREQTKMHDEALECSPSQGPFSSLIRFVQSGTIFPVISLSRYTLASKILIGSAPCSCGRIHRVNPFQVLPQVPVATMFNYSTQYHLFLINVDETWIDVVKIKKMIHVSHKA